LLLSFLMSGSQLGCLCPRLGKHAHGPKACGANVVQSLVRRPRYRLLAGNTVVRDTGIEPVTSSVSGKRSPAELIAPAWRWRRESNPCARLCRPLPHHSATPPLGSMRLHPRADDGIRTRDPHLGKVMRYQLRYIRAPRTRSSPVAKDDDSPPQWSRTNCFRRPAQQGAATPLAEPGPCDSPSDDESLHQHHERSSTADHAVTLRALGAFAGWILHGSRVLFAAPLRANVFRRSPVS
jgi:hypothetical protein